MCLLRDKDKKNWVRNLWHVYSSFHINSSARDSHVCIHTINAVDTIRILNCKTTFIYFKWYNVMYFCIYCGFLLVAAIHIFLCKTCQLFLMFLVPKNRVDYAKISFVVPRLFFSKAQLLRMWPGPEQIAWLYIGICFVLLERMPASFVL